MREQGELAYENLNMMLTVQKLTKENQRLRAALEDINQTANSLSAPNLVLNSISHAARAALEAKDD